MPANRNDLEATAYPVSRVCDLRVTLSRGIRRIINQTMADRVAYSKIRKAVTRFTGLPYGKDAFARLDVFVCETHGLEQWETAHMSLPEFVQLCAEAERMGNKPDVADVPFPNPSAPMTKESGARIWGGSTAMLTKAMDSGDVRFRRSSRQRWTFCLDDMPNPPLANTRRPT